MDAPYETTPRPRRRRRRRSPLRLLTALLLLAAAGLFLWKSGLLHGPTYTARQLGIPEVHSSIDYDGDGVEDYADMVQGVRDYFETKPHYKSAYYAGGYPSDGCGVCTDVIWHAFAAAGYDLKALVDADIQDHPDRYDHITVPDSNIDFRRVRTLRRFFDAHAQSLTTDTARVEEWQAGDIVVFGADEHIGICSDRRNRDGLPLLLHHADPLRETTEGDDLPGKDITGHYRWPG